MRDPTRKPTRRSLALWDRLKFIILLVVLWFLVVWYQMSNDPILVFHDAALQQLPVSSGIGRWILLLLGIEVVRQLSFFSAERSHRYYRASTRVFSGTDRVTHRFSDYSRFRVSPRSSGCWSSPSSPSFSAPFTTPRRYRACSWCPPGWCATCPSSCTAWP